MKNGKWLGYFVLVLILAGGVGCGQLDGQGTDGAEYTGSIIQVGDLEVDGFVDVGGPTYEAATFTVKFYNEPTYPDGEAKTDIILEYYVVQFFSSDPGSVQLSDVQFVASNLRIKAGNVGTLNEWPYVPVGTQEEYLSKGGNPAVETIYQAVVTFYGHNQFGYPVSVELNLPAFFMDY